MSLSILGYEEDVIEQEIFEKVRDIYRELALNVESTRVLQDFLQINPVTDHVTPLRVYKLLKEYKAKNNNIEDI